ncbi:MULTISPECIES: hypothetical protein [unclassified Nocardia]|nr:MULTISPECIES: hypothetical protein [unclassified Nocardia]
MRDQLIGKIALPKRLQLPSEPLSSGLDDFLALRALADAQFVAHEQAL